MLFYRFSITKVVIKSFHANFSADFFTLTLLLVAKQTRKTTLYDNIITIIATHTPEQKKEALRPLLTFMANPLRNGMYNSDRSYQSHRPSYR